jgi:hypothetical protein
MTRLSKGAMLAAASLALAAGVNASQAQTTVITREPVETQTVVTPAPVQLAPVQRVQLTPVQRQTIYRTIVREQAPPQTAVEYQVGARIPQSTRLYAVPQQLAVEVPAVKAYKYMVVNDRVLLVDPATSEVVAELAD